MPIPPSQLSICRQKLTEGASPSTWGMTVAPVVVSPDIDSKNASVKPIFGKYRYIGIAAIAANASHNIRTRVKPSRGRSSRLNRRVASRTMHEPERVTVAVVAKAVYAPSEKA